MRLLHNVLLTCLLASLAGAAAAAEIRQPLPSVHAVTGVRAVTAPGETIENATIVVRDGRIEAVGEDVAVPPDAEVVDLSRGDDEEPLTVYPGLIDPYVPVRGGADDEEDSEDESEASPGRHPLVTPDRTVDAAGWPNDKAESLRRAGFTTALFAPAEGLFRGTSVLANTGDGGLMANRLRTAVAQHASLHGQGPDGAYPQSLMGSIALVRQTLSDARWQARAETAWRRNPDQPRPEWIEGVDALVPALDGEQPLVVVSEDMLDTLRILEVFDDEVQLVIVGHGEEYRRIDALTERRVPHILPLAFPEAPDVEDADDRDVALEELRHWHRAPTNPGVMAEAGIPVLLTSHSHSDARALFKHLATAIERGYDADAALAALTVEPARWLGIDEFAGRIAPGYMANFFIVDGELFAESPSISEVWIDGERMVLAALEPPEVDPAGTWELTLGLGAQGDVPAKMVLTGPPTNVTGTITVMGNETPLTDVKVSGPELQIRIDASRYGGSGTIAIDFEIEGDRGRGNGRGPFGDFTVRGQRVAPPETEVL